MTRPRLWRRAGGGGAAQTALISPDEWRRPSVRWGVGSAHVLLVEQTLAVSSTPDDVCATIFHALGIGPTATIPGPTGTPVPAYTGRAVVELF